MGRATGADERKEPAMEEQENQEQSSQEWESGEEPEADEGADTGKQEEVGDEDSEG
jgi:hypothetical protein